MVKSFAPRINELMDNIPVAGVASPTKLLQGFSVTVPKTNPYPDVSGKSE
jgi:hypothetical protein